MSNTVIAMTLGVMLAASSSPAANASPLAGNINIDGGDNAITSTLPLSDHTSNITFTKSDESTLDESGTPGDTSDLDVDVEIPTFVSTFTIPDTSGIPFPSEPMFSFLDNGSITQTFAVTSVTTGSNGSLYFYGALSGYPGSSVYDLSSDHKSSAFTGTLTLSQAPEPGSLVLLGTGLLGAAVLMFRKRRHV